MRVCHTQLWAKLSSFCRLPWLSQSASRCGSCLSPLPCIALLNYAANPYVVFHDHTYCCRDFGGDRACHSGNNHARRKATSWDSCVLPIFALAWNCHCSASYLFTRVIKGKPVRLNQRWRAAWIVCYCLAVFVSALGLTLKASFFLL